MKKILALIVVMVLLASSVYGSGVDEGLEEEMSEFSRLRDDVVFDDDEKAIIIHELSTSRANGELNIPENGYMVYINRHVNSQYAAVVHYDAVTDTFSVLGADSVSTGNPDLFPGDRGAMRTPSGIHYVQRVGNGAVWSKDYQRKNGGSGTAFGGADKEVYDISPGSGAAFHCTTSGGQRRLGEARSHGCARMSDNLNDFIDEHDLLAVGSPVIVVDRSTTDNPDLVISLGLPTDEIILTPDNIDLLGPEPISTIEETSAEVELADGSIEQITIPKGATITLKGDQIEITSTESTRVVTDVSLPAYALMDSFVIDLDEMMRLQPALPPPDRTEIPETSILVDPNTLVSTGLDTLVVQPTTLTGINLDGSVQTVSVDSDTTISVEGNTVVMTDGDSTSTFLGLFLDPDTLESTQQDTIVDLQIDFTEFIEPEVYVDVDPLEEITPPVLEATTNQITEDVQLLLTYDPDVEGARFVDGERTTGMYTRDDFWDNGIYAVIGGEEVMIAQVYRDGTLDYITGAGQTYFGNNPDDRAVFDSSVESGGLAETNIEGSIDNEASVPIGIRAKLVAAPTVDLMDLEVEGTYEDGDKTFATIGDNNFELTDGTFESEGVTYLVTDTGDGFILTVISSGSGDNGGDALPPEPLDIEETDDDSNQVNSALRMQYIRAQDDSTGTFHFNLNDRNLNWMIENEISPAQFQLLVDNNVRDVDLDGYIVLGVTDPQTIIDNEEKYGRGAVSSLRYSLSSLEDMDKLDQAGLLDSAISSSSDIYSFVLGGGSVDQWIQQRTSGAGSDESDQQEQDDAGSDEDNTALRMQYVRARRDSTGTFFFSLNDDNLNWMIENEISPDDFKLLVDNNVRDIDLAGYMTLGITDPQTIIQSEQKYGRGKVSSLRSSLSSLEDMNGLQEAGLLDSYLEWSPDLSSFISDGGTIDQWIQQKTSGAGSDESDQQEQDDAGAGEKEGAIKPPVVYSKTNPFSLTDADGDSIGLYVNPDGQLMVQMGGWFDQPVKLVDGDYVYDGWWDGGSTVIPTAEIARLTGSAGTTYEQAIAKLTPGPTVVEPLLTPPIAPVVPDSAATLLPILEQNVMGVTDDGQALIGGTYYDMTDGKITVAGVTYSVLENDKGDHYLQPVVAVPDSGGVAPAVSDSAATDTTATVETTTYSESNPFSLTDASGDSIGLYLNSDGQLMVQMNNWPDQPVEYIDGEYVYDDWWGNTAISLSEIEKLSAEPTYAQAAAKLTPLPSSPGKPAPGTPGYVEDEDSPPEGDSQEGRTGTTIPQLTEGLAGIGGSASQASIEQNYPSRQTDNNGNFFAMSNDGLSAVIIPADGSAIYYGNADPESGEVSWEVTTDGYTTQSISEPPPELRSSEEQPPREEPDGPDDADGQGDDREEGVDKNDDARDTVSPLTALTVPADDRTYSFDQSSATPVEGRENYYEVEFNDGSKGMIHHGEDGITLYVPEPHGNGFREIHYENQEALAEGNSDTNYLRFPHAHTLEDEWRGLQARTTIETNLDEIDPDQNVYFHREVSWGGIYDEVVVDFRGGEVQIAVDEEGNVNRYVDGAWDTNLGRLDGTNFVMADGSIPRTFFIDNPEILLSLSDQTFQGNIEATRSLRSGTGNNIELNLDLEDTSALNQLTNDQEIDLSDDDNDDEEDEGELDQPPRTTSSIPDLTGGLTGITGSMQRAQIEQTYGVRQLDDEGNFYGVTPDGNSAVFIPADGSAIYYGEKNIQTGEVTWEMTTDGTSFQPIDELPVQLSGRPSGDARLKGEEGGVDVNERTTLPAVDVSVQQGLIDIGLSVGNAAETPDELLGPTTAGSLRLVIGYHNDQIRDERSHLTIDGVDLNNQEEFDAWFNENPENRQKFAEFVTQNQAALTSTMGELKTQTAEGTDKEFKDGQIVDVDPQDTAVADPNLASDDEQIQPEDLQNIPLFQANQEMAFGDIIVPYNTFNGLTPVYDENGEFAGGINPLMAAHLVDLRDAEVDDILGTSSKLSIGTDLSNLNVLADGSISLTDEDDNTRTIRRGNSLLIDETTIASEDSTIVAIRFKDLDNIALFGRKPLSVSSESNHRGHPDRKTFYVDNKQVGWVEETDGSITIHNEDQRIEYTSYDDGRYSEGDLDSSGELKSRITHFVNPGYDPNNPNSRPTYHGFERVVEFGRDNAVVTADYEVPDSEGNMQFYRKITKEVGRQSKTYVYGVDADGQVQRYRSTQFTSQNGAPPRISGNSDPTFDGVDEYLSWDDHTKIKRSGRAYHTMQRAQRGEDWTQVSNTLNIMMRDAAAARSTTEIITWASGWEGMRSLRNDVNDIFNRWFLGGIDSWTGDLCDKWTDKSPVTVALGTSAHPSSYIMGEMFNIPDEEDPEKILYSYKINVFVDPSRIIRPDAGNQKLNFWIIVYPQGSNTPKKVDTGDGDGYDGIPDVISKGRGESWDRSGQNMIFKDEKDILLDKVCIEFINEGIIDAAFRGFLDDGKRLCNSFSDTTDDFNSWFFIPGFYDVRSEEQREEDERQQGSTQGGSQGRHYDEDEVF